MRWLVTLGLALLAVAAGGAVDEARADPAAPQLSPGHGRREDSQRLQDPLQDLDRRAQAPPAASPAAGEPRDASIGPPSIAPPPSDPLGTAGVVLLFAAGGTSAAAAAASDGALRTGLLVTAAASAVAGVTFVIAHHFVHAAPVVAPHAVGVALVGHL